MTFILVQARYWNLDDSDGAVAATVKEVQVQGDAKALTAMGRPIATVLSRDLSSADDWRTRR